MSKHCYQPNPYRKICCCSLAQLCPTLCDTKDCITWGFPVLHCLLEFAEVHVHWWWCFPTVSSSATLFSFCLQSFPASGSFPMSQLFASGGQITGASTLVSVFLVDIQGWFPLGLNGWVSLQTKELSSDFFSTTVWKHHRKIDSEII